MRLRKWLFVILAVYLLDIYPLESGAAIHFSADSVTLPPAYVGSFAFQSVTVSNVGDAILTVFNVTTNGYIWTASPTNFSLIPGEEIPVTIQFAPTFEHEFAGTIEFFSDDLDNPRDSVRVYGMACHPVLTPPPPLLRDAAAPTAIYFSIPWDQNGESVEYAVEYSSDGFVTSYFVVEAWALEGPFTYATAWDWGVLGQGAITGLLHSTTYEVRLHVRDCLGVETIGPSAAISTRPEIIVDNTPELTIKVTGPNSVQLNWNPIITDIDGNYLPNSGWIVYYGDDVAAHDSVVAFVENGPLDLSTASLGLKAFFSLEPLVAGVNDPPSPFISWPPDGATIGGPNSVVVQDLMHELDWDSFRVEIDSAGFPALLASSWTDPQYLGGNVGSFVDFDRFTTGPHFITATIVDRLNRSFSSSINVEVVQEPWASWIHLYDQGTDSYNLTATDIEGMVGGMAGVLWFTSSAGERYGESMTFERPEDTTGSVIIKASPIPVNKVLSARSELVKEPHAPTGVNIPDPTAPPNSLSDYAIDCCDLTMKTTGNSRYKYGTNAKKAKEVALGITPTCKKDGFARFSLSASFEIELILCYRKEDPGQQLTYGCDLKGTETTETVNCDEDPWSYEAVAGSTKTVHHKATGTQPQDRPYSGAGYAKTSSRPKGLDKNLSRQDWSNKACGAPCAPECGKTFTVSWIQKFAVPPDPKNLPEAYKTGNGTQGKRIEGEYQFLVSVFPQCDPQPNTPRCCDTVDLTWNLVCCPESGGHLIEVEAPAFGAQSPVPNAADCNLAAN